MKQVQISHDIVQYRARAVTLFLIVFFQVKKRLRRILIVFIVKNKIQHIS